MVLSKVTHQFALSHLWLENRDAKIPGNLGTVVPSVKPSSKLIHEMTNTNCILLSPLDSFHKTVRSLTVADLTVIAQFYTVKTL